MSIIGVCTVKWQNKRMTCRGWTVAATNQALGCPCVPRPLRIVWPGAVWRELRPHVTPPTAQPAHRHNKAARPPSQRHGPPTHRPRPVLQDKRCDGCQLYLVLSTIIHRLRQHKKEGCFRCVRQRTKTESIDIEQQITSRNPRSSREQPQPCLEGSEQTLTLPTQGTLMSDRDWGRAESVWTP